MAIQLDLRRMIRDRIEVTRRNETSVYLTDGNGVIQLYYSDGENLYATRLRLGQDTSQSAADIGIVV